jgi:hypothetical protein
MPTITSRTGPHSSIRVRLRRRQSALRRCRCPNARTLPRPAAPVRRASACEKDPSAPAAPQPVQARRLLALRLGSQLTQVLQSRQKRHYRPCLLMPGPSPAHHHPLRRRNGTIPHLQRHRRTVRHPKHQRVHRRPRLVEFPQGPRSTPLKRASSTAPTPSPSPQRALPVLPACTALIVPGTKEESAQRMVYTRFENPRHRLARVSQQTWTHNPSEPIESADIDARSANRRRGRR